MRLLRQHKPALIASITHLHICGGRTQNLKPFFFPVQGCGFGYMDASNGGSVDMDRMVGGGSSPLRRSWIAGSQEQYSRPSQPAGFGIGDRDTAFESEAEPAGVQFSCFKNAGDGSSGEGGGAVGGGGGGGKEARKGDWFRLSDSFLLSVQQGDITKWVVDGKTDAIVNAANERMLGGGGVDGAIHKAAGPKLLEACLKVPEIKEGVRCPVGTAVMTRGFNLPASKIIHTVGPIYENDEISSTLLNQAYKSSMVAGAKAGVKYIAFPAISCGVYGYPIKKGAEVALQTIQESAAGLQEVHFVLFNNEAHRVWLTEAEARFRRV